MQEVALLSGGDPSLLFYVFDHPDEFKEILDWYIDWEVEIARSMYEAGANIVGMGETAAYFMSPRFFENFCLESEKKALWMMKPHFLYPLCFFIKDTQLLLILTKIL